MFQKPAYDCMAGLVVSDGGFFGRLQNPRLLFQTADHPLDGLLEVCGGHSRAEVPCRNESCFVTDVGDVGP